MSKKEIILPDGTRIVNWHVGKSARRPEGNLVVKYSLSVPGERTKSRERVTGFMDVPSAEAYMRQWVKNIDLVAAADKPSVTMAYLFDLYSKDLVARGARCGTNYPPLNRARADYGDLAPTDIDDTWIEAYIKKNRDPKREGGPLSVNTITRDLSPFCAALKLGRKRNLVPETHKPEFPHTRPKARTVYMDREVYERCLIALEDYSQGMNYPSRITLYGFLALETGARKTAIEELTWDRVMFKRGIIDYLVPGEVYAANKKRVPNSPITDRLLPMLKRAYAARDPGNPLVLGPGEDTNYYWNKFKAQADPEFAIYTQHDMRRTFASLRLLAGVDILRVATLLGDTPETARKHYAFLNDEALTVAANLPALTPAPPQNVLSELSESELKAHLEMVQGLLAKATKEPITQDG